ncbi:MAG: hypothetical protein A2381_10065 [Bdellovibrionales bacterium RIFOXYB1_FULL_37_110]|nr:MAG: hypothetical protein A2417_02580 [Bdellovibrionales bacterium RIFOXYC1_FULL_37_79]OFZ61110.1 MAG: hypothetical protein A2381_10065 [Bdellovibrionales bacterium RIFOXYB1_FULL_37_110]OFZ61611.1 MAG: hypothetical protein A2577_10515 [Bdellovibrionales bacterium RIFOXYD1_FULL_36_51]
MPFDDIKNFSIQLFLKLPLKKLGEAIKTLLNKIDEQKNKITDLSLEIQKLKDEINRFKGEKGKPVITKNKDNKIDNKDKKKDRGQSGRGKNKQTKIIEIHKTEEINVDKKDLPQDAQYKGTREVVIQDINFNLNNTKFLLHKYYSPFSGKVFEGKLPPEYIQINLLQMR